MADDSRIASILGEWIEKRDRGEEVAPEEVIAAHPELADELRRRFAALTLLEEARDEARHLRPLPKDRYGDYRVAGEGGMGIVYWALDTDLNRQVAFKIVKPQGDGGAETPSVPLELSPPGRDTPASSAFDTLKARFLQEAWVTAGLEHPGIVPVYELGETAEGVPYYTMRFVRGSCTLASAIEAATNVDQRLALLEPFLKVCDTIRYAHAHGVIHRDLKPENVAIGEFGEVVVLDWGLAKLKGQEDAAAEVWQERLEEYREATDLRTVAGALGTPGYMSLEAALGEVDNVDERSDVYSLGAMLYQLLTGRLPHVFTSYAQMVGVMLEETPAPAHEVDPQIPVDLSMICASALAREKEARFASAGELAEALRRWQRESAVEREVRELLVKAEAAFEGTEGLEGEALLKQIDRVTSACSRITDKKSGHPRAEELVRECGEIRKRAIAERERAARGKLLKRVAALVAVLLLAIGLVVVLLLDAKRREAEDARAVAEAAERSERTEREAKEKALASAETERDAKKKALSEVLRLADVKKVRDLVAEAEELWPVHPDRAEAMADWTARVLQLLEGRATHEATLAALRGRAFPYTEEERLRDHAGELSRLEELQRELGEAEADRAKVEAEGGEDVEAKLAALSERAAALAGEIEALEARVRERASWRFEQPTDAWQHGVLADLVAGIAKLADGEGAILKTVETRHALVANLAASIEECRDEWDRSISAIAEEKSSPAYRGLEIEPIYGLVPLGKDPDSGLYEFAHLGSGTVPRRDPETGRLVYQDDSAIVLVLIPGAKFHMGAQMEDSARPNYDPQTEIGESPIREISLRPYLIAKHECTQAQWAAMTGAERPSTYGRGQVVGGREVTDRNPVEMVSFDDLTRWLARHRLRLPSEAEWEHACRAGTGTPWITGREVEGLAEVANIADAYCKGHGGPPAWTYTEAVDDGHTIHAPVGSYRANAFGLFDMHGNVFEWCEDWLGDYAEAPEDGSPRTARTESSLRVYRGGSWIGIALFCRSADRNGDVPGIRGSGLGFRPAADLPR